VEKRYNFRIYPTAKQEERIQKNFGCCRFVYNYYLSRGKEAYEKEGGLPGLNECSADLTQLKKTEGYEWLAEADANSLLLALKDLDHAWQSFFRRRGRGEAPGFPRFRNKRGRRQSYGSRRTTGKKNIEIAAGGIKLPKLGWTRCRLSRFPEGRVLSATVFQTRSGKYFVSVCCTEVEPRPLPKTGASVGLHLGLRELAVTSDGARIENPKYGARSEKKIARLRRRMSRKPKDSANREKARRRLARACERAANQRSDYLHQLTARLVRTYDLICLRQIPVAERVKDRRFSKQILDAGWGELARQLRYKCDWYGKELVFVDEFFPGVQTCAACGFVNVGLKKSGARAWDCPRCGARCERGVNAAKNILAEGKRTIAEAPAAGPKQPEKENAARIAS
jgi:putative transposase